MTHSATTAPCTRVLVVEDDITSRNALMKLLTHFGWHTTPAGTVAEALEGLSASPDCVILDLMLPDGNGTSVLDQIRSSSLPIRVAIATGAHDRTILDEVTRLGPDVVFKKPLDFQRLISWLKAENGSA